MPSTYTTSNRVEKQGAGENNNSWGTRLNTNTIDMFDEALDGVTAFTLSTTKTLSEANGSTDESRPRVINITSGTGGTVTIPNVKKNYLVRNATSGNVIFTTGSGTTTTVTTGGVCWIVCVGGNVIYQQNITVAAITSGTITGITDLAVADGGTGASTAAGACTNLGVGTGDSPQFTAVNVGHATDTTVSRASAGDIAVEGNVVYRAGGTDVPVTDGGTGASTAAGAATNLGLGTGDSPQFTGINLGHATDTTLTRASAGNVAIEGNLVYRASGTDVPVADGGTGASSAAAALANLGAQAALTFASNANGSAFGFAIGGTTYYLQAGTKAVNGNSAAAVTFPQAFAGTPVVVVGGGDNASDTDAIRLHSSTVSTTGFSLVNPDGSVLTGHWIAIGA